MSVLNYSVQKAITGGTKNRAIVESYQNGRVTVLLADSGQRLTNLQTPETQLQENDIVTVDYSNGIPYVYYENIPIAEIETISSALGKPDEISNQTSGVCSGKVISSGVQRFQSWKSGTIWQSHLMLDLDVTLWDTHNAWGKSSDNNYRLSIPQTGIYFIEFTCRMGDYAAGENDIYQMWSQMWLVRPSDESWARYLNIGSRNTFNWNHAKTQNPGIQLQKLWSFSKGDEIYCIMDIDVFGAWNYAPYSDYSSLFERGAYPTFSWVMIQEIPENSPEWATKYNYA